MVAVAGPARAGLRGQGHPSRRTDVRAETEELGPGPSPEPGASLGPRKQSRGHQVTECWACPAPLPQPTEAHPRGRQTQRRNFTDWPLDQEDRSSRDSGALGRDSSSFPSSSDSRPPADTRWLQVGARARVADVLFFLHRSAWTDAQAQGRQRQARPHQPRAFSACGSGPRVSLPAGRGPAVAATERGG